MKMNTSIKYIIINKIKLEIVKHFQSAELDQLKEQFKKEFIKLNNKLEYNKDLKLLEKYDYINYIYVLKISKHSISINNFNNRYEFNNIKFNPKIKLIKSNYIQNQILNHPKIKKLANEIYLLSCNIESDIKKLMDEYLLRIDSCKDIETLLKKFPDMKKFNLLEEIQNKNIQNKNIFKTSDKHKKIINEFYITYFKKGDKK